MSYITIFRFALIFILYTYSNLIVQEKYINSKFTIFTNWLIYLAIVGALIWLEIYTGITLMGMVSIGVIISITIMWIINTVWSRKVADILSLALLVIFILALFI